MTRADIRAGLLLSMAEMIRTGTVGFLDMFLWDSGLLADVRAAGLRVNAAPAVFGYDAVALPVGQPANRRAGVRRHPGPGRRVRRRRADQRRLRPARPLQLWAGVARRRRAAGRRQRTRRADPPVRDPAGGHARAWPRTAGRRSRWPPISGCSAVRTHVAHAVHPEPGDAELLAAERRHRLLQPGLQPQARRRDRAGARSTWPPGFALALGTDSMASNNSADLFEEIKFGALLQRGSAPRSGDPAAGADTLAMATSGGARALRRPVGSARPSAKPPI